MRHLQHLARHLTAIMRHLHHLARHLTAITRRLHHLAQRVTTITRHLHHHQLHSFVAQGLFNLPKRAEAMEGLGIFGDLPQLDPLPAVGSNHDNASHTHDDRVNIFGDLPQLDPLPAVGSNHAPSITTPMTGLTFLETCPSLIHCQPLRIAPVRHYQPLADNMLKRTRSRHISLVVCHHCRPSVAAAVTAAISNQLSAARASGNARC